jgi:hypothetical protein
VTCFFQQSNQATQCGVNNGYSVSVYNIFFKLMIALISDEIWTVARHKHRTMHRVQTDEVMVPLFAKSSSGQKGKHKYVAGSRNYATADWDARTGELKFDIRVEKEKGFGETEGSVYF